METNDVFVPETNCNICHGNTYPAQVNLSLCPFQFVYETLPSLLPFPYPIRYYRCHLIAEGTGTMCIEENRIPLSPGDILFLRPGPSFTFEDIRGLKYFYITFSGLNVDSLLAEYNITEPITIFSNFTSLIDQWTKELSICNDNNLSTLTKGLLYTTFAHIMNTVGSDAKTSHDIISQIRNFIDGSYGNSALSLEYVCKLYNYHPNYISRRFHAVTGYSFSEYLELCRIQNAKQLLADTRLPIHVIASSVGYRDSMYFSKVFKKNTGETPSTYREHRAAPSCCIEENA